MRSRSEKEAIGKVVEISVLGIATRLLRARREYLFPVQTFWFVFHWFLFWYSTFRSSEDRLHYVDPWA